MQIEDVDIALHGKDIIFIKDDWEDWGFGNVNDKKIFQISYKCFLTDENESKPIGMVKIWNDSQINGDEKTIHIDDEIKSIDDLKKIKREEKYRYFSLGTSTYYENLKSIVSDQEDYEIVLSFFNDISLLFDNNVDDDDEKENINEIKETPYFSMVIDRRAQKQGKDSTEYVREKYKKDNVTYTYRYKKKRLLIDSDHGIYKLKVKQDNEPIGKLIDLFLENSSPTIVRGNELESGLYTIYDLPGQILVIGDNVEINSTINKDKEEQKDTENTDEDYKDYYHGKKEGLIKKLDINPDEIKSKINDLNTSELNEALVALNDNLEYNDFKSLFNYLKDPDIVKRLQLPKDFIGGKNLMMILQICSMLSRNQVLIIANQIVDDIYPILNEIIKDKHAICIYLNERENDEKMDEIAKYISEG